MLRPRVRPRGYRRGRRRVRRSDSGGPGFALPARRASDWPGDCEGARHPGHRARRDHLPRGCGGVQVLGGAGWGGVEQRQGARRAGRGQHLLGGGWRHDRRRRHLPLVVRHPVRCEDQAVALRHRVLPHRVHRAGRRCAPRGSPQGCPRCVGQLRRPAPPGPHAQDEALVRQHQEPAVRGEARLHPGVRHRGVHVHGQAHAGHRALPRHRAGPRLQVIRVHQEPG